MLSSITAKAKATWQQKQPKKSLNAKKSPKDNASKSNESASNKKWKANANKRALSKKENKSESTAPSHKKRKLNESSLSASTSSRKPGPHQTVNKKVRNYKQHITYTLPLAKQKQRSVIKLSSMPEGMEEDELKTFFYQFGYVTRFCVKRHRYGRPLSYAYVEFGNPDIAKIVVDTLNCVLLYGTMLDVKEIAAEDVKASFWRTHTIADAKCFTKMDRERERWQNHATIANLEYQFGEWQDKMLKDEKAVNEQLKALGIDYEFNGLQEEIEKYSKKTDERSIDGAKKKEKIIKQAETFLEEESDD